jgi:hypothetical protein
MLRWYEIPVEDALPAEDYFARAKRFHDVAEELDPAIGARFEAMAVDAFEIATRKALKRSLSAD